MKRKSSPEAEEDRPATVPALAAPAVAAAPEEEEVKEKGEEKGEEKEEDEEEEGEGEEEDKEHADQRACILQAVTEHTDVWKKAIAAAAMVVDDGDLEFTENGMMVRTFFSTQAAYFQLQLRPAMFQLFILQEPALFLGQSFKKMDKVLHRLDSSDSLSIKYMGSDRVAYEKKSSQIQNSTRTRHLKVLSSSQRSVATFETHDHCIKLKSKALYGCIQDLVSGGAKLIRAKLSSRRTQLMVEDDDGEDEINWPHPRPSAQVLGEEEGGERVQLVKGTPTEYHQLYKLEPFLTAAKAFRVAEWVHLYFCRDAAVKIEYLLPNELGVLMYIIAPRSE